MPGVPKGINLGPLLFIIFINDLQPVIPDQKLLIYADDVKLYSTINSINDCQRRQPSLNVFFSECCASNLLTLCVDKCTITSFNRKKYPITYNQSLNNRITEPKKRNS